MAGKTTTSADQTTTSTDQITTTADQSTFTAAQMAAWFAKGSLGDRKLNFYISDAYSKLDRAISEAETVLDNNCERPGSPSDEELRKLSNGDFICVSNGSQKKVMRGLLTETALREGTIDLMKHAKELTKNELWTAFIMTYRTILRENQGENFSAEKRRR